MAQLLASAAPTWVAGCWATRGPRPTGPWPQLQLVLRPVLPRVSLGLRRLRRHSCQRGILGRSSAPSWPLLLRLTEGVTAQLPSLGSEVFGRVGAFFFQWFLRGLAGKEEMTKESLMAKGSTEAGESPSKNKAGSREEHHQVQ